MVDSLKHLTNVSVQILDQAKRTNGRISSLENAEHERALRVQILSQMRADGSIPRKPFNSDEDGGGGGGDGAGGINISLKQLAAIGVSLGGTLVGGSAMVLKLFG